MKKLLTLAAVTLVLVGVSSAAVITTYTGPTGSTGKPGWEAAVGAFSLFQFTGNFNASSGPTTVSLTQTGNNNYSGIVGNLYQDVLTSGQIPNQTDPSLLALSTTTLTWSGGPMFAVGGLWNTAPNNEGGKINIVLNLSGGGTQAVQTIGPINGFFGWISSAPFDSFTLSTNNNLFDNFGRPYGVEHYTLDDLQISAVPEPATLSMVGLALLGLGAIRRYRRS